MKDRIEGWARRRWPRPLRGSRGILLFGAGLLCFAAIACQPEKGPDPRVLSSIDKSFQPLRRDFEANRDKVRLVAVVSPTCGQCQTAVRAFTNLILPAIDSPDLEVFCVWVSNVPPDVEVRARILAAKSREPRLRHYWDDSGRIGRAFGRQAGLPEGECLYDVFYLYGRGDSWDPGGAMASEPVGWNAMAHDWTPAAPRARFGDHPNIRMPTFDHRMVTERLRELLGEARN